jgi:hypothetical protein
MISVMIYGYLALGWLMAMMTLSATGSDTLLVQYGVTLAHLVVARGMDWGTWALACWDASHVGITPRDEEMGAEERRFRCAI